jgi:lipopolysaccharide assembly protein A
VKYLVWLLKAAVFFTLFAFSLNNQDSVDVRLFFGAHWQAPLVLVLLVTLALGVLLGILVMVPVWLKARRNSHKPSLQKPIHNENDTRPHGI